MCNCIVKVEINQFSQVAPYGFAENVFFVKTIILMSCGLQYIKSQSLNKDNNSYM